jgi:hypothetical protein
MKKLPVKELIRQALIYAEQDREAYLDAISNCNDKENQELKEETKSLIKQMKEYRRKRYGLNTRMDYLKEKGMPSISLQDLLRKIK